MGGKTRRMNYYDRDGLLGGVGGVRRHDPMPIIIKDRSGETATGRKVSANNNNNDDNNDNDNICKCGTNKIIIHRICGGRRRRRGLTII